MNSATRERGFTLLELLVVIAIISILAVILFINIEGYIQKSNDAQRQADLREVQTALELYKNKYNRYPEGCNSAATWSGQVGTSYECTNSNDPYIYGNPSAGRPFAEFLSSLPQDPSPVTGNRGYVYTTNADGTVYKFMAKNTVESDAIGYDHPFKSCDVSYNFVVERGSPSMQDHVQSCDPPNSNTDNVRNGCDIAMCDRLYTSNSYNATPGDPPNHCRDGNAQFESSYAVWGGIANANAALIPGTMGYRVNRERNTEAIICM